MGPDAPCRFGMTDRLRAALATAAARLADVSGTPRLDAELLMAHALGVSRESLLLGHMDDAPPAAFSALLARRLACAPGASRSDRGRVGERGVRTVRTRR